MVDLVGTCPKGFWNEWIAEGDAAGDGPTGTEWGWWTRDRKALLISPGDRFYVVAHDRLRGWATVTRLQNEGHGTFVICREGGAVSCTLLDPVPGFRGLRKRWWDRADELPFPNWKNP